MNKQRPTPEKLLQKINAEEQADKRGKLKIYLGACPGVGKTYTMLQDAAAKRAQGLDVVVGIVETHGRKEVDKLLSELEVLPRQIVNYHGKELAEFNLDATLKRSPGLILIDEMAHTNAEGTRHTKRWQDINELLDRGIDVWTTLNVQHVESLNDAVAQIIHAPVKEIIPDAMLEKADAIELIDLPPEELLKRLQEGKIYIPQQAEIAAEHFFLKGNLIALRELALRLTARRVGEQVLSYRQGQGIKYIWPTREKILVCVGPGPEAAKVIRIAYRIATSLQVDWIAVFIDTPHIQASPMLRSQVITHLHMAEKLGAETRILTGSDVVKEILAFAREQNVTQVMIWRHVRSWWKDMLFGNLADQLVRFSEEIDVYVVTKEMDSTAARQSTILPLKQSTPWHLYAVSFSIVAAVTIFNLLLFPYLRGSNLIMVYLLAVTGVALFGETGPSLVASLLSVLAYDYFFIPPYYGFFAVDLQYFFTLIVMLSVAQVISHLTITTRRQADRARLIGKQTSALLMLTKQLNTTWDTHKLLEISATYMSNTFDCGVIILLTEEGLLKEKAQHKAVEAFTDKDYSVAQWVYDFGSMAGLGTETLSNAQALYVPLTAMQKTVGVMRLRPHQAHLFTPEQLQMIEACASQIGMALDVSNHLQTH